MADNLPNAQLKKLVEEAKFIQANDKTVGGRKIAHAEKMAAYTIEDLAHELIEERSRAWYYISNLLVVEELLRDAEDGRVYYLDKGEPSHWTAARDAAEEGRAHYTDLHRLQGYTMKHEDEGIVEVAEKDSNDG